MADNKTEAFIRAMASKGRYTEQLAKAAVCIFAAYNVADGNERDIIATVIDLAVRYAGEVHEWETDCTNQLAKDLFGDSFQFESENERSAVAQALYEKACADNDRAAKLREEAVGQPEHIAQTYRSLSDTFKQQSQMFRKVADRVES